MDDWKDLESWHEDLKAWERFQDELERINGEYLYERLQDFQNRNLSLQEETFTQSYAKYCKSPVEQ